MSNKSDRITIRVKPEDKKKIKQIALEKEMTISDLCLLAMLKFISAEEDRKRKIE